MIRISATPTFAQAFRFWLKLGFTSFGGPAGQIALMHEELVVQRRWISERRFLHALNYCMLLPGPEAQQLATYIGWLMHRTAGGIVAGVLFVLPSLFILIALSWTYVAYGDVPAVAGLLYGIKPTVTAIVAFAAYRIGRRALTNGLLWSIAAAAFLAMFALNVPFPMIALGAGMIGFIGGRLVPDKFAFAGTHSPAGPDEKGLAIDDDAPPAAHTRFCWRRCAITIACGVLLWAGLMAILAAAGGMDATLTRMGWFFTKSAFLTFGGAYAVLPYVHQAAVEQFQWLTAGQMIDGLALGETTPGPLIMIVAFVGFVGAWTEAANVSGQPLLAGISAAVVAVYFTFLPSFLFILIGAPLVESTRGDIKFTAPLTGITAAVVGVILNLALFFARHVFWPNGLQGGFDGFSAALCFVALVMLARFRIGIIPLIALSAVAGFIGFQAEVR